MVVRLADKIQFDSIVDGPGLRAVIWFQGCFHNCKGCHNPQTHDPEGGFDIEIDDIVDEILRNGMVRGVTFSGGDPLLQNSEAITLAKKLKEYNINIWCYTGFEYETLSNSLNAKILFKYLDVLIDRPFIEELKSYDLQYRGSTNQRIIDMKKTLEQDKVILWEGA